jgi:selenocysteine lyase/cysteine desulfurase
MVGVTSLNLPGLMPAELAEILDGQFDVAVRAGLHCAPYAHHHLGTVPDGTVRISVGLQNTEEEMTLAATAFNEVAEGCSYSCH